MNVERWVSGKQSAWQKLEDLLKQIEKNGLSSLSREQLRALGLLYRSTASDLSRARAMSLSPDITAYLNSLVVRGHNQVYQSPRNRWKDLWHFLWITFPEVFRNNIPYVAVSLCFVLLPMIVGWFSVINDVNFAHLEVQPGHAIVPDELWSMIEKKQMWTDAVQDQSPIASSFIATNNIKVSLLAFVLGVTGGVGTIYVLITNGILIGSIFAVCQLHGLAHRLAAFVAPHGVFEMSAIFISGGAGLLLARSILFPGEYSRLDSFKKAGSTSLILFLGCVPLLLIAGLIEGFISPRTDLPQEVKYAISLITFILLALYLLVPRKST